MMSLGTPLIGRLGNQMFQWAHAKKLAENSGRELSTPFWPGLEMFDITPNPIGIDDEILPEDYHQRQESLIYTRADCKRWFKWRPEFVEKQGRFIYEVAAHYRAGDYLRLNYPVVSKDAIRKAIAWHIDYLAYTNEPAWFEESGTRDFMEDFYMLTRSQVIFRANSSFSWWAATLSDATIYSPMIDRLEGGKEHDDVQFVVGNWPRLASFPFTTDLHLEP